MVYNIYFFNNTNIYIYIINNYYIIIGMWYFMKNFLELINFLFSYSNSIHYELLEIIYTANTWPIPYSF